MRMIMALAAWAAMSTAAAASEDPYDDLKKADAELNQTFRLVEKRLSGDAAGKARLVTAQRAWIAFRDAECAFQSSGEDGGSVAPMVIADCSATLTGTRTEQLKRYLACEEGDLSCPVPGE